MTSGDTLSVLGLIVTPILKAYELFDNFLRSTNLTAVWSAMFLVVLVVRFILKPIVGSLSAGSDFVKSKSNNQSEGS